MDLNVRGANRMRGFSKCFLQTFAKTDLPKQHRMVKEGDMMTMDHNPERYVFFFPFLF